MAKKTKAIITQNRTLHTHAELWHASQCVLRAGQENPTGAAWQFLSSAILTAFAFEAYLNHLGPKVIQPWQELERLSPIAKFTVLCDRLDVAFPGGNSARPLNTINELFKFRNQIAHGKTIEIKTKPRQVNAENIDHYFRQIPRLHWEHLVSDDRFAVRAREDVEAALIPLHKADPDPVRILFGFGMSFGDATAL
jgi:hypothetical protein